MDERREMRYGGREYLFGPTNLDHFIYWSIQSIYLILKLKIYFIPEINYYQINEMNNIVIRQTTNIHHFNSPSLILNNTKDYYNLFHHSYSPSFQLSTSFLLSISRTKRSLRKSFDLYWDQGWKRPLHNKCHTSKTLFIF